MTHKYISVYGFIVALSIPFIAATPASACTSPCQPVVCTTPCPITGTSTVSGSISVVVSSPTPPVTAQGGSGGGGGGGGNGPIVGSLTSESVTPGNNSGPLPGGPGESGTPIETTSSMPTEAPQTTEMTPTAPATPGIPNTGAGDTQQNWTALIASMLLGFSAFLFARAREQ